jgi:hypothetical protein
VCLLERPTTAGLPAKGRSVKASTTQIGVAMAGDGSDRARAGAAGLSDQPRWPSGT